MKETPLPTIAGILNIISGVITLFIFLALIIITIVFALGTIDPSLWDYYYYYDGPLWGLALSLLIIFDIIAFALSTITIIGGIFAILRKRWALALIGSILALFPILFVGIASITLIALSKDEFIGNLTH